VHVHCFTSSLQFATALQAHFPNLCFGFTGAHLFAVQHITAVCLSVCMSTYSEELATHVDVTGGYVGVVTFNSAREVQNVVKQLPLERLLLETDAPYMAPVPFRGRVCHSGHIPLIAQRIAALCGIALEDLYAAAARNAARIYNVRI
jgi:TatD DNase family protein